jgi:type II secretory pathway pseudopilin PulG
MHYVSPVLRRAQVLISFLVIFGIFQWGIINSQRPARAVSISQEDKQVQGLGQVVKLEIMKPLGLSPFDVSNLQVLKNNTIITTDSTDSSRTPKKVSRDAAAAVKTGRNNGRPVELSPFGVSNLHSSRTPKKVNRVAAAAVKHQQRPKQLHQQQQHQQNNLFEGFQRRRPVPSQQSSPTPKKVNQDTATAPTPKKVNQDTAAALKLYQQRLEQYQQQHQQNETFEGFQRRRPVPSQPDCIVAFHIPKTGGSSYKSFLYQVSRTMDWRMPEWYGYWNRYQDKSPSKLDRGTIDKYMIREKAIHIGHLTPTFLKETATQNCLTVTMLREPVDRVVSAFYYHKHKTSEWESCLKHDTPCRYAHEYQNDVTRRFSSNVTWNSYNQEVYSAGKVDRERLERAQQFLMDTDLVCFLDQFDDCKRELLAMANLTGTVPSSAGPKDTINVGKKRENITAATRSKIELVNSLDIELYEWAVQQFRGGNLRRKSVPKHHSSPTPETVNKEAAATVNPYQQRPQQHQQQKLFEGFQQHRPVPRKHSSPTPKKVNQDSAVAVKPYQQRLKELYQQRLQYNFREGFQRRRPVPSQQSSPTPKKVNRDTAAAAAPTPKKVNQDAAAALKLYQQRLEQYQQQHQQNETFEGFQRRRPVPSQPDCIVAFHIPKTGGSSYRSFLDQVSRTMDWRMPEWYAYWKLYRDKSPSKLDRGTIDKYMIREKAIHTGHLTPAFLKETATQNCLTVTMLREPVDRVISAFYYHKHTTSEWESCLKHDTPCRYARYYQNDVTRLFSSNVTWNSYNEEVYLAERADREHLKRAQQFLMDTDLVCFLDQFDDCKRELLAMANLTGTVPPSAGPKNKLNIGRKRENVTAATRSKIELVNLLDIELYEWAVQQFRGGNRRRKR